MSTGLAAFIYISIGIAGGAVLARNCFVERRADINRIALAWIVITAVLFLTPSAFLFAVVVIGVFSAVAPRDPGRRFLYYCAILPAAPVAASWVVPFPGVDNLFNLQYHALVNLAALLSLAFAGLGSGSWRNPFVQFAIAYVLLCIGLDFRGTTFTNGLRLGLEQAIVTGMLLIGAAQALRRPGAVNEALVGIMIAGVIMACIGMIQFGKHWTLYDNISSALSKANVRTFFMQAERGGLMRIDATMAPIPFGIYMALCIALLLLQKSEPVRKFWRRVVMLLLLLAMYLSGSRGAIICLLLAVGTYIYYSPRFASARGLIVGGALVVLLAAGGGLLDSVVAADEYGTFGYRLELLRNSTGTISAHPLFGTPDFMDDPMLQLSKQGQGIIDIVNAYLQVTLRYGFVGLLLFVAPLVSVLRHMTRERKRQRGTDAEPELRLVLALVVAYSISIVSVSMVDRLGMYYWILLSIGFAAARMNGATAAGSAPVASGTRQVPARTRPGSLDAGP